MNYYKRHLGDYSKKAARLSMLQHGAYNLLIDSCYDREKFPTLEEAIEWTWASTESEIDAVKFVLARFFKSQEDGTYHHKRIAEELHIYRSIAATNKRIALEREANRKKTNRDKSKTSCGRSVNEAPPNHKPLTTNHKPNRERESTHGFPSVEEAIEYAKGQQLPTDAVEAWHNNRESQGWVKGNGILITNWQADLKSWIIRDFKEGKQTKDKTEKKNKQLEELGIV